jgi:fatty-acyl-CoA synthase
VDDAMTDVPRDGRTMGEVVMRGNIVMKGYYNDPEGTAAAFRGGWFHSGDLGVSHPDGYIELRDRKKDIIISGEETAPAE